MNFDSNLTEGLHSVNSGVSHNIDFMGVSGIAEPPSFLHTSNSTPHFTQNFDSLTNMPPYNTGMNVQMNMYPKVMNIHMNSPQHHHHYHYPQPNQSLQQPQTTQPYQSYGAS